MSHASDELYSESIRIESKVIYADLRANARGQYLKLSETGGKRPRSTVLLPGAAVKWVHSLIDFYIRECSAGRQPPAKELAVENKVFHFSVGANDRGRFLRISELGVSHSSGRHTLVIPCGPAGDDAFNGWAVLRSCVFRVSQYVDGGDAPADDPAAAAAAASLAVASLEDRPQLHPPPPPHVQYDPAGPSSSGSAPAYAAAGAPSQQQQPPDVSHGSIVGPGPPPPSLGTSPQGTPVLSVHGRRMFFDVGASSRGSYMRITEVKRQERSTIVVPAVAVPKFRQAVDTCATLLEQQQQRQEQPQQQQPQQPAPPSSPPPPPQGHA